MFGLISGDSIFSGQRENSKAGLVDDTAPLIYTVPRVLDVLYLAFVHIW